jgi:hypothetical protein
VCICFAGRSMQHEENCILSRCVAVLLLCLCLHLLCLVAWGKCGLIGLVSVKYAL